MRINWSVRLVDSGPDLALVEQLFREYRSWHEDETCFAGFEKEVASLPSPYIRPSGALLLATLEDEPVGCAGIKATDDRACCELKRLYVRPVGRGMGIGLGLVRRALREGQKLGYDRIRLDSLAWMEKAISLYREMGFREIEPYRADVPTDAVFLGRSLR